MTVIIVVKIIAIIIISLDKNLTCMMTGILGGKASVLNMSNLPAFLLR